MAEVGGGVAVRGQGSCPPISVCRKIFVPKTQNVRLKVFDFGKKLGAKLKF